MSSASSIRRRAPRNPLGMELREQFATNVRFFREQKGMSQGELARAADIGREFINRIERGRFTVNLERLGAIAAALNVSPITLITPGTVEKAGSSDPEDQALAA